MFLVLQDAFVLCRVTKRNDWALENGNGNEVGNDTDVENRNPNPQQPNSAVTSVVVSAVKPEDAAASVICAEDPNQVATPAGSAQLSNDVAMAASTGDTASPNGSNEVDLDALLEEMLDSSPSFNSVPDIGSSVPFVTEQYAESSVSFLTLTVVLVFSIYSHIPCDVIYMPLNLQSFPPQGPTKSTLINACLSV